MDLSSLGAHSAGIWTRREALARLSRARVAAMLREGYWQSPLPGIYADGGTVLDPEQRAYAAVLASGEGAVAAGRTAARVFGLPLIDDDDPATDAYDLVNDDVAAASSRSAQLPETSTADRARCRPATCSGGAAACSSPRQLAPCSTAPDY